MIIAKGLMINDVQIINWNSTFEEFQSTCRKHNVEFQCETVGKVKRISLPITFANFGRVRATVYFRNDLIKEVYITSIRQEEFNPDRYVNNTRKLSAFFGEPRRCQKNKALWIFDNIKMKYFYTQRDDAPMDYLVLEICL